MTGDVIAERYELGPLVGTGGSSRVYRARDRRLGRDVAVKVLDLGGGDPQARERFVREALVGGRISHPNAVKVFDAGESAGVLFITMELVTGEDLAQRLARVGPLPERDAVDIAVDVLDVLDTAHRAGVIHRDVKPSNILLGTDGRTRLVDFGIAKPLHDLSAGLTRTGEIIGTAKYLAPEQAASQPLTPSTDLYAVGVVLFEALSGRPPFTPDTPMAMAIAHRDQTPPLLVSIAPSVQPAVAAVVDQALAKNPTDRPSSASAMANALRSALDGGTIATAVLPRPPETSSRPSMSTTRRTLAVVSAAVVVLLAASTIAWLNRSDDSTGDDVQPAGTASETSSSTTTTARPATTSPTTTTTTVVSSIGALTDLLAASPDAYGKKAPDLLDKLQKIQRERGRDQFESAGDLLEDIDDWVEDGEIDPDIASQARQLLEPLADRGPDKEQDD